MIRRPGLFDSRKRIDLRRRGRWLRQSRVGIRPRRRLLRIALRRGEYRLRRIHGLRMPLLLSVSSRLHEARLRRIARRLRVSRLLRRRWLRRICWRLLRIACLLICGRWRLLPISRLLLTRGILWSRWARRADSWLADGMLRGRISAGWLWRWRPARIHRWLWLRRGRGGPSRLLRRRGAVARLAQPRWQIAVADERASREAWRLLGGAVRLRGRGRRAVGRCGSAHAERAHLTWRGLRPASRWHGGRATTRASRRIRGERLSTARAANHKAPLSSCA